MDLKVRDVTSMWQQLDHGSILHALSLLLSPLALSLLSLSYLVVVCVCVCALMSSPLNLYPCPYTLALKLVPLCLRPYALALKLMPLCLCPYAYAPALNYALALNYVTPSLLLARTWVHYWYALRVCMFGVCVYSWQLDGCGRDAQGCAEFLLLFCFVVCNFATKSTWSNPQFMRTASLHAHI